MLSCSHFERFIFLNKVVKMFDSESEFKQRKRGSCFVQASSKNRPKLKKSVFTNSSNDDIPSASQGFYHHRKDRAFDDTNVGDSNKSLAVEIDEVKSKTYVVERKKGHFTKLKKNNIEFQKFLDQKSRSFDVNLMKASIEKIQAKIDELTKTIEAKATIKSQTIALKIDEVEQEASSSVDWKKSNSSKALTVACGLVIAVLLILCYTEGKNIFRVISSLNLHLKAKKPKSSWFYFF